MTTLWFSALICSKYDELSSPLPFVLLELVSGGFLTAVVLETTSSCGGFDEASETVVDAEPNVLVNVFELDKGIFGFGSVLVLKPENPLNP